MVDHIWMSVGQLMVFTIVESVFNNCECLVDHFGTGLGKRSCLQHVVLCSLTRDTFRYP